MAIDFEVRALASASKILILAEIAPSGTETNIQMLNCPASNRHGKPI
jgi:hypothetical protein